MSNDGSKNFIKNKLKSHLPKDWLTELRIIYCIALETINGIKRTGLVNIAIITTMAITLTVFCILLRAGISLSTFTKAFGDALEISVFLKDSASVQNVIDNVKNIEHVKNVTFIPKEQALKIMKLEFDGVADVENPLPNTLHVKVDSPKNIQIVSDSIKKTSGVEDINYAQDIAKKIQIIVSVVHSMILIVGFISALFTITIINNTIHLVIQSRKEEIEIMRLMGGSNWYIKTPLIMQGAIYGFIGSLIALFPLNWFQGSLLEVHEFFKVASPSLAMNIVIFVMFLMAIIFGATGSFLSIKKHLQV